MNYSELSLDLISLKLLNKAFRRLVFASKIDHFSIEALKFQRNEDYY